MNALAVIAATLVSLGLTWLIAGPRWGITVGSVVGAAIAVATLNTNGSLLAQCKDYPGGGFPGCIEPTWWDYHGQAVETIITLVVIINAVTWGSHLIVRRSQKTH